MDRQQTGQSMHTPTQLIVMGVSGCGKSTVGEQLAQRLGWHFLEGDHMHPQANIDKMHAGHPLNDVDRKPWLDAIGKWLRAQHAANRSSVVTCSALKRCYRERLAQSRSGTLFLWLRVDRDELERRLRARYIHFMPASLLDSQLATLEIPGPDEPVITVDADGTVEATIQAALVALREKRELPNDA